MFYNICILVDIQYLLVSFFKNKICYIFCPSFKLIIIYI